MDTSFFRQCFAAEHIFTIYHFDIEILFPDEVQFIRTYGEAVSFYQIVKITDGVSLLYLGGEDDDKLWKWSGTVHHFVSNGKADEGKQHWVSSLWKEHRERKNSLMVPMSCDGRVTAFATRMEKKNDVTVVGASKKEGLRAINIGKSGCLDNSTPSVMDVLKAKRLIERLGGGW